MTTQLAVHELSMMRDLCKKDHMETQAEVLDCAIWAIQTQDILQKERDAALARNKVIDQIEWERDTAIQQLAELGYGFGEKIRTDGDCISRQAAIDAMEHKLTEPAYLHTGEDWYVGINSAEFVLYDLPSAQPELDEWCTECKEYDKERHCCPRWNRVIRQTLEDVQPEPWRGDSDAKNRP